MGLYQLYLNRRDQPELACTPVRVLGGMVEFDQAFVLSGGAENKIVLVHCSLEWSF